MRRVNKVSLNRGVGIIQRVLEAVLCAVVLIVIIPPAASATTVTSQGVIERMTGSVNYVRVYVPSIPETDGCSTQYYFRLENSHLNDDALLSMLISAHMSGKEVHFLLDGCIGNMSVITNVYLHD